MRSLIRHLRREYKAIPVPWESLAGVVRPGPRHLMVVIAAPGVGKSALSLSWALRSKPALFFSWDTDLRTQGLRIIASLKDRTIREVEQDLPREIPWLESQDLPVRFVEQYMDIDEMEEVIRAEREYWGQPPALTVIDNLRNLVREESVESFSGTLTQLQKIARRQDTAVMVLHHVKRGPSANGDVRPRTSDGLYAGERDAEFVLGLWREHDRFFISVLKNRLGPDGQDVRLEADLERMRFTEPSPVQLYADRLRRVT